MTTAAHRDEIIAMYQSGLTLQGIGDRFGVTRERIRQLLRKWNVARNIGGRAMRGRMRRTLVLRAREARCLVRHGCSWAEYKAISSVAKAAYSRQKKNARSRGISFDLRIAEWWSIWQASGKWDLRGRRKGQYVMSRKNDKGAYAAGNVYITTVSVNCAEGGGKTRNPDSSMQGIYRAYPGSAKPWLVKFGTHYLGVYATPEDAKEARRVFLSRSDARKPHAATPQARTSQPA